MGWNNAVRLKFVNRCNFIQIFTGYVITYLCCDKNKNMFTFGSRPRNNVQWNYFPDITLFISGIAFRYIVCKIVTIVFRLQCINFPHRILTREHTLHDISVSKCSPSPYASGTYFLPVIMLGNCETKADSKYDNSIHLILKYIFVSTLPVFQVKWQRRCVNRFSGWKRWHRSN